MKDRSDIWVVVKTMVPFWVLNIIRHLVFRGPKGDHFDNHPYELPTEIVRVVVAVSSLFGWALKYRPLFSDGI